MGRHREFAMITGVCATINKGTRQRKEKFFWAARKYIDLQVPKYHRKLAAGKNELTLTGIKKVLIGGEKSRSDRG